MSRIKINELENTTASHKALFKQVEGAFGTIPNMFKVIGNSEAALESMWTSFGALGKGKIGAKLGEQIAVFVADINRCEYCLAAHTVLGKNAGATAEEMAAAQKGESLDARTQAALVFTRKVVEQRASIKKDDVEAIRNAGFNDEEIAEILAHVALNIFTNYTNIAFDVPVDFPKISLT